MKNIIVCSKNVSKNNAVKNVLKDYIDSFEVVSLDTTSKVSETPIGDEEGITGCLNRIEDAVNQEPTGDLYVAMEGILTKNKYGTYLCGWTVIYNKKDNEYYYGCSAKVKIPDEVIETFDKTKRLSDVVAKYYGNTESEISKYGTNGMITNGVYTRTDEFMDSVKCAISSKYEKI